MQINENYNTSLGKYGKKLTKEMENSGINPNYLLSAGRFFNETGVPIKTLSILFKQWNTYVVKNNKNIDVNSLSYEQFREILNEYKRQYGIANKVYDDGTVSIGRINNAKDIAKFPVKNNWCIKQPGMFQKYTDQGYIFYIIDNGNESNYVRYVILMIGKDGSKYYYDLDNEKMTLNSISEFQTHLTQDAIAYIQNINENKEYKINNDMSKKKYRITENELKQIVAESVKNVLTELDWKTYKTAANKIRDKRSKYIDGEGDIWNYDKRSKDDYAKKLDNSFYDLYDAARDSLEKQFGYEDETGSLCFPILGAKGHLSFFVTILDANRNPMEYPYNEASKDLIDAYRRAKFELGNFNDPHSQTVYPNTPSNYEYKRGEGWIKKQNLSQKELGDRNSHFY